MVVAGGGAAAAAQGGSVPESAETEVATIGAILSESGIHSTLGPPEHNAIVMGLEALNATGFDVDGTHYTTGDHRSPTTSPTRRRVVSPPSARWSNRRRCR